MKTRRGFTLVELLVVIAILGILATAVFVNLNPLEQFKKARDSQRYTDLAQIQTALAAYHVDNGRYPASTGAPKWEIVDAPWGGSWPNYLQTVPKDPVSFLHPQYAYVSDGQTFQLYAKFEATSINPKFACGICGPDGAYTGGIDSQGGLLYAFDAGGGGAEDTGGTGGGGQVAGQSQLAGGEQIYYISTKDQPKMTQVDISELDPKVGQNQTIAVKIQDDNGNPISAFSATLKTDSGQQTYPMELKEGTAANGTWQGAWKVTDTHNTTYMAVLTATSASGASKVELSFR